MLPLKHPTTAMHMSNTALELHEELARTKHLLAEASTQVFELAQQHDKVLLWVTTMAAHHEEGNHEEVKKCLDNVIANKNRLQQMQH